MHRRPSRWQIDDAHVAPPHAAAHASAERLGAGFLGGEALGVGLDLLLLALGALAFFLRENAREEALAVTCDHLLDAPHVGDIGADAEDHAARSRARARPLSIA